MTANSISSIKDVYSLLGDELGEVRSVIRENINSEKNEINSVINSVDFCSGKMLRPLLLLLSGKLLGKIKREHISASAAIELIHNATLLHDDVIDKGTKRRNRPTVNAMYGNESAVLFGDFLLTRVFELICDLPMKIQKVIANSTSRLCQGELSQVLTKNNILSEKQYLEIIADKTATLYSCACHIAALISDAEDNERKALLSFGHNFGTAYQITDDIIDLTERFDRSEKTPSRDITGGKVTLPLIHFLENEGITDAETYLSSILDNSELLKVLEDSGSLDYCSKKAGYFLENAKDCLGIFKESVHKTAFLTICDFTFNRISS